MKGKFHFFASLILFVYAAAFFASAPAKVTVNTPPPIKAPNYDYEPPEKAPAKSAQVVFLLVDPAYRKNSHTLVTKYSAIFPRPCRQTIMSR